MVGNLNSVKDMYLQTEDWQIPTRKKSKKIMLRYMVISSQPKMKS